MLDLLTVCGDLSCQFSPRVSGYYRNNNIKMNALIGTCDLD